MAGENDSPGPPPDATWHELPSRAGSTHGGTFSTRGLRPPTAQLIYIGSSENGFADAGRCFPLADFRKVQFGRIAGTGVVDGPEGDLLDIGVPVPWVSGAHAELELQPRPGKAPELRLVDLDSRNGTAIEGVKLQGGRELRAGQVFELGRSFWMVRELLEGSKAAPPDFEATGTVHPPLARVYRNLERIAHTKMPVLLVGETGAGKDHLARRVHERSGRQGQFVKINLVGISMGELLMGDGGRAGLLQQARGGTVYVDELASLERDAQTKLGSLLSYADDEDSRARGDLRVVASTTRDLRQLVESGEFRPDLYSRLAHYEAHIPPLRDRREDLGLLMRVLTSPRGARPLRVETAAFRRILGHSWPFNVRELKQTLAAVHALADDEGVVSVAALDDVLRTDATLPSDPLELQRVRDELVQRLKDSKGSVTAVARAMGRTPEELGRVLRQFHLDAASFSGQVESRGSSSTLIDMVTDAVTGDQSDGD